MRSNALSSAIPVLAVLALQACAQVAPQTAELGPADRKAAEGDFLRLVHDGIPFAEEMLATRGEFLPFGAAIGNDGQIQMVMSMPDEDDQLNADAGVSALELIFGRWVDEGTVSAIAMFSNVRVKETADSEGFAAVHVGYEHQVGYSVNAFYPYALTGGAVEFGDVTGEFRESTVFVDGG